ncbi:PIG-L family deacetylase [Dactylosporangium sp. NPDC049525]|uniref:PIG-L deacetylase family protein n=1 Tax=Dactylosporangium sp. NPDC049525 TaxID=3154730 RepID=UPI003423C4CC
MTGLLVIAAHPDDAELAIGGTIAQLHERGTDVAVCVVAVSEFSAAAAAQRVAAAESAAAVLGHRLHWLPGDAREQVEQIPEALLVRRLDELVDAVRPRAVATHWDGDSHADHARTARAAIASSRRWGDVTLLQFGPNETRTVRYAEFVPNVYVPLPPPAVEAKRRSIEFYNYAGQGHRRLDSQQAEARDAARGFEIGAAAAEAFRLVRTCGGLPFLTAT